MRLIDADEVIKDIDFYLGDDYLGGGEYRAYAHRNLV